MDTFPPGIRAMRPPLQPSLRGTGLPFSVLRGIVAQHKFSPPANRARNLRRQSRAIAERLAKVPKQIWQLKGIDWRLHARRIDGLAQVEKRERTAKEARDHTARIAATL